MEMLENPINWVILAMCIGGFVSSYYYFSRYSRLQKLKKLGFKVSTKISSHEKSKIAKIASVAMAEPYMAPGSFSIGGGILVWWLAKFQKNKKQIYFWVFRRTESHGDVADIDWYQVIYAKGFSKEQFQELSLKANQSINCLEISQNAQSLTIVSERAKFSFKPTLNILSSLVSYA